MPINVEMMNRILVRCSILLEEGLRLEASPGINNQTLFSLDVVINWMKLRQRDDAQKT